MRIVRSWPKLIPPGKSYVVDQIERVVLEPDYDYRILADLDDDVIHLDWDVAVSLEDLKTFVDHALRFPELVITGPQLAYPTKERRGLRHPVWSMRRYTDGMRSTTRYVQTDEPSCHLAPFGMIYLPSEALKGWARYKRGSDRRWDDTNFCEWNHLRRQPEIPIAWDVQPVHLHYQVDEVVRRCGKKGQTDG